ncbi:MAG: Gfo/Idh/MocA family oxidoreductase [Planctomycetes bacterium]|jgi:predicted dehydrogenase|nr:Gfo/Idh/MocA family oxidoreductase [Planctomycetota bacterium]
MPDVRKDLRSAATLSRRRLLQQTAAVAAFTVVPRHVLGGQAQPAPSATLQIAGVGIGGVGRPFLQGCAQEPGTRIAFLCDVDHQYARPVFEEYPQARRYRDYREMLEKEDQNIDAVLVATPDHTHAAITMEALRRGKHVLCVKPLTRTIHEAHTVMAAARAAKVATQVTASSSTSDSAATLCEMIQAGAIGAVREVHCWSNRPLWPQGMARPAGSDPVPAQFDWDLWLGPAPVRPFKDKWGKDHLVMQQAKHNYPFDAVYHPWNFRGWWDFGTGALGDMGCHHLNTLFRALELGHPTSVWASSTKAMAEATPLAATVAWEFPARGPLPTVTVYWYDGGIQPPRPSELEDTRAWPNEGNLYVGDKGKILGDTNSGRIIPQSKMQSYTLPPKTLPRSNFKNIATGEWIRACRGGEPASCNFEIGGLLAEVVLLGNIAIRRGKKLYWDPANLRFTNDDEANRYVQEPYRDGWKL